MQDFQNTLTELKAQSRYRSLSLPHGIDLTSNDYLGMAAHPKLRESAIESLEGGLDIGAAGSRLLRGHTQSHESLERYAAEYFGAGKTLYFANGFLANYALLTTLPARRDIILYDSLIHASMRDGISAGAAKSYKFAHNNLEQLESLLKRHRDKAGAIWIAVESVYSMDGDQAPLEEIYALAKQYDAIILIDEAHATGIYGENGKGLAYALATKDNYERIITIHTCGKAIGVAGGMICAHTNIIEYMINKARPFIYSTAPMPLQALLVQKSLEILASEEGDIRRQKLQTLCAQAKGKLGGSGTQIIPIILGEDSRAVHLSQKLREQGYDIRAIRPPTVPKGTARLRLSLSSIIEPKVLQNFMDALEPYL